jgi:2-haloacid dehalogenase
MTRKREHDMKQSGRGWLTFECYGTLVDWRTGMEQALATIEPTKVPALLAGYHRAEPGLQLARPTAPYREVLRDGLRASAAENLVQLTDEQEYALADTMATWPVFPETAEVLKTLKDADWKLGILSNVDNEVIERTLPQLGIDIDLVVTSQDVGSYKPALPHFLTFRDRIRPPEHGWVHVACSMTHDVQPARAMGVPAVLIDREQVPHEPDEVLATLPDLTPLPDTVERYRSSSHP